MRKILLTGSTGFIGRFVLDELLKEGFEVHCIINKNEPEAKSDHLHLHLIDLLDKESESLLKRLCLEINPEICLHIAWYTNHKDYLHSEINNAWLEASKRLIKIFYETGGKRFIGAGTCLEYALEGDGRFSEADPLGATFVYSECKLKLYHFIEDYCRQHGYDYNWVRIFFVYGLYDRDNRLIPYIISSLNKGEKASPRNGGLRRDYIFAEDLAREFVQIIIHGENGVFNTGTGEAVEIQEIFSLIAEIMGKEELIELNDQIGENEFPVIEANIQKLEKAAGEIHLTSLKEGLKRTVEWYLSN